MPEDYEKLRLEALDRAQIAGQLVKKEYFTKLVKAVRAKKEADFKTVCTDAGIPAEMADRMWTLVKNSHAALYATQASGPIW